jgi:hypothetical protein
MRIGNVLRANVQLVADACLLQVNAAADVVGKAVLRIVDAAVDLENESQLGAIEVDDVASEDLLAPELQPEASPISEQLPGGALGRRGLAPKLAGQVALLDGDPRLADERLVLGIVVSNHSRSSTRLSPQLRLFRLPLSRKGEGAGG